MTEYDFNGAFGDALLRVQSVNAREVLRLIFRCIIEAHPIDSSDKSQTRVKDAELALFGSSAGSSHRLEDEEVMLFMYRKMIESKACVVKGHLCVAPKGDRILTAEDAAESAVDTFHPELTERVDQPANEEDLRRSLVRRYKEKFYSQRRSVPERYYEVLDEGDEARIVAEFVLQFLGLAGLRSDSTYLRNQVIAFPYNVALEYEEDLARQADKKPKPKKLR